MIDSKYNQVTDIKIKKLVTQGLLVLLLGCSICFPSVASDNNKNIYAQVDNWDVEGQHGTVYVLGSLTENPCRLAMRSSYQTVDIGNLDIGSLQKNGQGIPVPLEIKLEDCLQTSTRLENIQTGMTAWSSTQPAVKIRFVAPSVATKPNYAKVNGTAKGLGLALTTQSGELLPLKVNSNPKLLQSGQSTLIYYVTPIKIGQLQPGTYSALIAFEMLYD